MAGASARPALRHWKAFFCGKVVLPVLASISMAAPHIAQAEERSAHANYVLRCAGCHTLTGAGLPAAGIPDFRNLVGAFVADEAGRTYFMHVPGVIGASLTEQEIADVLNYVVDTWGGSSTPAEFKAFSASEVTQLRDKDIGDVVKYRRELVEDLQSRGIPTAEYPWP